MKRANLIILATILYAANASKNSTYYSGSKNKNAKHWTPEMVPATSKETNSTLQILKMLKSKVDQYEDNKTSYEDTKMMGSILQDVAEYGSYSFVHEVRNSVAVWVENNKLTGSAGVAVTSETVYENTKFEHVYSIMKNEVTYLQSTPPTAAVIWPDAALNQSMAVQFTMGTDGGMLSNKSETSTVISVDAVSLTDSLNNPIRLFFRRNSTARPRQGQCVSWKPSLHSGHGGWTTDGCEYHKVHSLSSNKSSEICGDANYVLDECWCYHATQFTELFIERAVYSYHDEIIDSISVFGFVTSTISIGLIIITNIMFPQLLLRPGQITKLRISINFLLLLILFAVATKVSGIVSYGRIALGFLIHFILLCNFSSMLVAAIMQYRRLVIVFKSDSLQIQIMYIVINYLIPLIPPLLVIITGNYREYCKLPFYIPQGVMYYTTIILPLVLVMCCNIFVFIIITRFLFKATAIRVHSSRDNFSIRVKQLLFLFVLLGLTWVFALCQLFLPDAVSLVFSYLFCISISSQGLSYFIFFVLMDEVAWDAWRNVFRRLVAKVTGSLQKVEILKGDSNSDQNESTL